VRSTSTTWESIQIDVERAKSVGGGAVTACVRLLRILEADLMIASVGACLCIQRSIHGHCRVAHVVLPSLESAGILHTRR
jgi:hypothetical protein